MGTVVTLPPRRASRASSSRSSEATILLFMGVRYIREIDAEETVEPAATDAQSQTGEDLPLEIA